jgi:hypothetical protein
MRNDANEEAGREQNQRNRPIDAILTLAVRLGASDRLLIADVSVTLPVGGDLHIRPAPADGRREAHPALELSGWLRVLSGRVNR